MTNYRTVKQYIVTIRSAALPSVDPATVQELDQAILDQLKDCGGIAHAEDAINDCLPTGTFVKFIDAGANRIL